MCVDIGEMNGHYSGKQTVYISERGPTIMDKDSLLKWAKSFMLFRSSIFEPWKCSFFNDRPLSLFFHFDHVLQSGNQVFKVISLNVILGVRIFTIDFLRRR